jgi:hypothetical protein
MNRLKVTLYNHKYITKGTLCQRKLVKFHNTATNVNFLYLVMIFTKGSVQSLHAYLKLSLRVSTVNTNQDWDFWTWQDKLFKTEEFFLTVEKNFCFVSVKIFKIKTFQSQLCHVRFLSTLLRFSQMTKRAFWQCSDWVSPSRPCQVKSRPASYFN